MTAPRPTTIAEYIGAAPPSGQPHLRRLYALLKRAAPDAQETIKWGTPFFVKFYFVCGVGAALCTMLVALLPFDATARLYLTTTIGASGAVYGLLMAWALIFPHREILFMFIFPLKARVFVLIVGAIVADKKAAIAQSAGSLLVAVFLVHAGGFGLGWLAARLLGRSPAAARTISIEVGMQNSGLGAKLARSHFSDPMTAVPSAISAVFHSLIGSLLAAVWRRR